MYHVTAAICISIELYDIVQLRSGDGVALPLSLSLTVGIVDLTLRGRGGGAGGGLLGLVFCLNRTLKKLNKFEFGQQIW